MKAEVVLFYFGNVAKVVEIFNYQHLNADVYQKHILQLYLSIN